MKKELARGSIGVAKVCAVAIAVYLLPTTSSYATDGEPVHTGDAVRGLRLAENWCASCHLVSAEQKSTSRAAPPFAQIAQSPTFDSDHLAYLLYDPHPNMAKLALSRRAIDDIAAYVISLRK